MSTLQTESPSPKNTEVVEHQAVSCELKVIQSPATPMLRWSRRPDNALDEVEDLKPPLPAVEEQQLILTISTKLCVIDESPTGYFEQYLKDDDEDDDRVEDASDGCTEESGDTDGSDNDWDDFSDIDNLTPNEQWLKMMVDASGPSSGPRSIPRQAPKDERRSISFGSTGMPSIFQRPRALGYDGTCDEFGQDKRSASAPVKSNLGSLTSSRIAAVSAENVDLDQSQAPTKKRDNMFDLSSEAALKHHEHKLEAVVFALNAVQHPVLEEALKSERDGLVSVIEISKAKIEMKKQDEMKQNSKRSPTPTSLRIEHPSSPSLQSYLFEVEILHILDIKKTITNLLRNQPLRPLPPTRHQRTLRTPGTNQRTALHSSLQHLRHRPGSTCSTTRVLTLKFLTRRSESQRGSNWKLNVDLSVHRKLWGKKQNVRSATQLQH